VRPSLSLAIVTLALCTGCASSSPRPEGVVEQWLLSLNRGAAGDPGRYGGRAAEQAAAAVLPDWHERDPGSIDKIQVGGDFSWVKGTAVPNEVPFRIEVTDGRVVEGSVAVAPCGDDPAAVEADGRGWCVGGASTGGVEISPAWTWPVGGDATDWLWAALAAIVLSLLAVGLVLIVRRTAGPALPAQT